MISQLQLNAVIRDLSAHRRTSVTLNGWTLIVTCLPQEKLLVSTPVYRGDGYVPKGVRNALEINPLEPNTPLKTSVALDESSYTVTLAHTASITELSGNFIALLEEFTWIAERWWQYLDERDRRDLVYLHVK